MHWNASRSISDRLLGAAELASVQFTPQHSTLGTFFRSPKDIGKPHAELADRVDWGQLSCQKLSISGCQVLSAEFALEFADQVN